MRRKRLSPEALHEEARRHVAAVRAFHTGLVAESHKHLHVLTVFSRHVDALRTQRRPPRDRLAAAQCCCRELANLRRLREPWRETYDDLRRSLLRARLLFRQIVTLSARRRRSRKRT